MKKMAFAMIGATVMLALGQMASADVISYSDTTAWIVAPNAATVSLPKYNGTDVLESVMLTLTGIAEGGSNTMECTTVFTPGQTATAILGLGTYMSLSDGITGGFSLSVLPQSQSPLLTWSYAAGEGYDGAPDYAGADTKQFVGTTATASTSETKVRGINDLSPYIGSGNLTCSLTLLPNSFNQVDGMQQNAMIVPQTSQITAKIIYTYTRAPEPATLAILGLGVVGLLRKKK